MEIVAWLAIDTAQNAEDAVMVVKMARR